MIEENKALENSKMKITGRNFLFALLIALIITFISTAVYTLMSLFLNLSGKDTIEISTVISLLGKTFLGLFQIVGMCFAPIAFLLAFALLQRFRIKN